MLPRVAVITVQYNNPGDTSKLVQSIASIYSLEGVSVIVVDNSTDPLKRTSSKALRTRDFMQVDVLRPKENLFYWGGADYAIRKTWREKGSPLPDWIVVCNNDLTFDDKEFFNSIRQYDGTSHPIIAPSILSSRGDQNPLLESPPGFFQRAKWWVYDMNFAIARSMLRTHAVVKGGIETLKANRAATEGSRKGLTAIYVEGSEPHQRAIYAPHGACIIFSRTFFERGGKLDTTVPMFAEELTIASLAKHVGMTIWYDPWIYVIHREHSTTGRDLTRQKYQMERAARRRYYQLERERRQ